MNKLLQGEFPSVLQTTLKVFSVQNTLENESRMVQVEEALSNAFECEIRILVAPVLNFSFLRIFVHQRL